MYHNGRAGLELDRLIPGPWTRRIGSALVEVVGFFHCGEPEAATVRGADEI